MQAERRASPSFRRSLSPTSEDNDESSEDGELNIRDRSYQTESGYNKFEAKAKLKKAAKGKEEEVEDLTPITHEDINGVRLSRGDLVENVHRDFYEKLVIGEFAEFWMSCR